MQYLLNELCIEMMKDVSTPNEPSIKLQKKLDLWKASHTEEMEKDAESQRGFREKHEAPRLEREAEQDTFMEGYRALRKEFELAPSTRKKATLQNWVAYSANIPDVLKGKRDELYTRFP